MTLVFISVSWIAGIYLATQTDLPWQSAALSLPASVLLALLLRGRAVTVVPAVALALLSLGAFRVGWPPETTDPLPIRAYNGAGATVVEGVVSSDPEPRGTGYRFALSVERVDAGEGWQDSRGLLRVVAVPSPSLVSTRR